MTATAKSQGPLFTKRALFTLIWPLLLEQTLSVTMGMADTLMVAAGVSCRQQIAHVTGRTALHPAEAIWQALR